MSFFVALFCTCVSFCLGYLVRGKQEDKERDAEGHYRSYGHDLEPNCCYRNVQK